MNRYGGPGDRWCWDMVIVVFIGAAFHDEGGYGGFLISDSEYQRGWL